MAYDRATPAVPSLSVIVPALNEQDSLHATVEAVLKTFGPMVDDLEILVFDDYSSDRTGCIADELAAHDSRVRVFHNPHRFNIGGVYKAGLREARGQYVVLVPGDNEIRVDEVARGMLYLDRASMIVFYVTNPAVRSWSRRTLSRLYVLAVNALFGTQVRYTNGTNIIRTDLARTLGIRTDGFSYQTEAVIKAVRSGADFVQVGVDIKKREGGKSKALSWKNLGTVVSALAALWWEIHVTRRAQYRRRGMAVAVV